MPRSSLRLPGPGRNSGRVAVPRARRGAYHARMSRWRPSSPASTAIITRPGHDRLKAELGELWRVRRPEVVRALAAAAAAGDRSQNAEYTYRQKQPREIHRRVPFLHKPLEKLRVVGDAPAARGPVLLGAHVAVAAADRGAALRHRIPHPAPAHPPHARAP